MTGNTHAGGINKVEAGEQTIGRGTAHGGVQQCVALFILRIDLIKEVQIGEIHHQLVTACSGDLLHLNAFRTVIDAELVVHGATVSHPQGGGAVTVFVNSHDHSAAARQFNGIGIAGVLVILVAVQQQHRRGWAVSRGRFGAVELVGDDSVIQ